MGDSRGGGFRVGYKEWKDNPDDQVDERYSCEKKAHERPRDLKKHHMFQKHEYFGISAA